MSESIPNQKFQIPLSVISEIDISQRECVKTLSVAKFSQETQKSVEAALPHDLGGYYFAAAANPQKDVPILNGDGIIYRLGFEQGEAILKVAMAKPPCYYADHLLEADRPPKPEAGRVPQLDDKSNKPKYPSSFRFSNGGPSRMSLILGSRNQLNTAFLKTRDHLLVTFDAGRPWIIDPDSLELVEPIGEKKCWKEIVDLSPKYFPAIQAPAHPVYDVFKNDKEPSHKDRDHFFTLNYSTGYTGSFKKRLGSFAKGYTRIVRYTFANNELSSKNNFSFWELYIKSDSESLDEKIRNKVVGEQAFHQMAITEKYIVLVDMAFRIEISQILSGFWYPQVWKSLEIFFERALEILIFLMNIIRRQKILPQLKNVIGNLMLVLDNQFNRLFNSRFPAQMTNFYIIDRDDLDTEWSKEMALLAFWWKLCRMIQDNQLLEAEVLSLQFISFAYYLVFRRPKIASKRFTIPREISHFTVNYTNDADQIVIYVGHNNASDVTEWIKKSDFPVSGHEESFSVKVDFDISLSESFSAIKKVFADIKEVFKSIWNREYKLPRLSGMISGSMDLGSLGRYLVDGKTGTLLKSDVFSDPESTWFLSVYTHRELDNKNSKGDNSDNEKSRVDNIYWMAWGFSWESIPDRIYQAYKNREFRVMSHTELPDDSKPCKLIRWDTQTMKIADSYTFPKGYFACTPQFIPKTENLHGDHSVAEQSNKDVPWSTDGYIVCVVLSDDLSKPNEPKPKDEFWIFDANNLESGDIYKLGYIEPSLNIGLTIHSDWLSPEEFQKKNKYCPTKEERCCRRETAFDTDYGCYLPPNNEKPTKPIEELFCEVRKCFIHQEQVERNHKPASP